MPRPVHFEIHAGDPGRARQFYETVFGWQFQQWGDQPYWLVTTGQGAGIDGGLVPRRGPEPTPDNPVSGFVLTLDVEDLDKTVTAIEQAGGTVALPRQPIPGVGWLAYFKDTEGNIFGAMQPDETAH
ncbi:MAG TPA: VOC family protein [Pseudonocardiaceae bacterium]|nr:VOC family protein [Pseudonocardiaceae bacterium]